MTNLRLTPSHHPYRRAGLSGARVVGRLGEMPALFFFVGCVHHVSGVIGKLPRDTTRSHGGQDEEGSALFLLSVTGGPSRVKREKVNGLSLQDEGK